jgi:hypothetical protein
VFKDMRSDRRVITADVDASLLLATEAAGAGAGLGAGAGAGGEVDGGEDDETYVEEELVDDEFEELEACSKERDALKKDDLGCEALPEAADEFEGFELEEACAAYAAFPDNIPLITAAAAPVSTAEHRQHQREVKPAWQGSAFALR